MTKSSLHPTTTIPAQEVSLTQVAIDTLSRGAEAQPSQDAASIEERSVWQPTTWLIQRCWQALADAGAGAEALSVARLAAARHALSPSQATYRLSTQIKTEPSLVELVQQALRQQNSRLLTTEQPATAQLGSQLLLAAATASILGEQGACFAYLERLDQLGHLWERIFAVPEERNLLAETVARAGLHPLTRELISAALRRFGDAGAEFLLRIVQQTSPTFLPEFTDPAPHRLLRRCVDALRFGMLTSLHSHRIAATVLAHAGWIEQMMQQLTVIANIQEARRASGMHERSSDQNLLRQVKRPQANADVDFQVYTLREAIRDLPMRQISREQRIELATHLVGLGTRSDGWTAAGAATTLVELGALKFAVEVVNQIAPNDPTRSEGVIALVRSLLAVEEPALASQQVDAGLAWVRTLPTRNPERALIWGLAEAYLDFNQPQMALTLLQQWREETGMRRWWRNVTVRGLGDDELRLKRLRLAALLQIHGAAMHREIDALLQELRQWAPRLLEGEALISFYVDGLLRPLLNAGRTRQAWALLPLLAPVLANSTGNKHAARVQEIAALLARQVRLELIAGHEAPSREPLARFAADLLNADSQRGIWQVVHGVEGILPLLMTLEGAQALVTIAHAAADRVDDWV